MRKIILMAVAGLALISSGNAWADSCDGSVREYRSGRAYYSVGYSSGRPSYGWKRSYHRPYERTFVVYRDARPVAVPVRDDTVVINIPNDNGSYTPVTLRRVGGIYVGPKGEQYITMPTVEQLKAIYGLK